MSISSPRQQMGIHIALCLVKLFYIHHYKGDWVLYRTEIVIHILSISLFKLLCVGLSLWLVLPHLLFFCIRALHSSGWPQLHCVAEDDFTLMIILSLPPKSWGCKSVPLILVWNLSCSGCFQVKGTVLDLLPSIYLVLFSISGTYHIFKMFINELLVTWLMEIPAMLLH